MIPDRIQMDISENIFPRLVIYISNNLEIASRSNPIINIGKGS